MAISRAQKEDQVAQLQDFLQRSQLTVLTAYRGLSVAEAEELRATLKQADGSFRVVKNALFKRAAANVFEGATFDELEGPVALTFGYSDLLTAPKVIADFGKNHPAVEPLGAIDSDGQWFDAGEVKRLASLPPREQLLGQVVGTMAAPLSGFVSVLNGNLRGLVTALSARAEALGK